MSISASGPRSGAEKEMMDVLGLGELAVGDGGHHAERREHWRPDGAATPLDDLHHVPEGASRHTKAAFP